MSTLTNPAIDTIKAAIEANDVVLFMKGTAQMPQCGFSSTVHGNNIAVEAQRAKLRLVVETAQEVWA